MILEVAILKIKPEDSAKFEAAFLQAEKIVASIPGYVAHELERCIESRGRYHLLIRWESIDAHLVNFRQSPKFQQWRELIGGFFAEPPLVEHYETVTSHRL